MFQLTSTGSWPSVSEALLAMKPCFQERLVFLEPNLPPKMATQHGHTYGEVCCFQLLVELVDSMKRELRTFC